MECYITYRWMGACLNFVEKTFTGGSQTAKFVKVFSLENFPLYGMLNHNRAIHNYVRNTTNICFAQLDIHRKEMYMYMYMFGTDACTCTSK